ncbi:ABC-2 type transport system permease protein [Acetitomaculum ruminis DSM 5522]|uniref:ABC-2 type transport system permease protein n=1 Tax=Acetitomaculum ruminis DSM 5522 TaxID=1120918 RepID=A0A1I0Z5R6_9FIRM|nr:Gldg family protein [Acetitomaculum ruminis]SFB20934.1 ABC-2 type transport system permease protein [Acetitomaculum ruminis DSM 5522]
MSNFKKNDENTNIKPKKIRKKITFEDIKKSFSTKNFKSGSYSFLLSAIVLAIVITINLVVGAFPSSVTSFDLSDQKLTILSDQTKNLISSVKDDVNIYLIAEKGKEDSTIQTLLEKYKDLSKHVKVKTIDPALNPNFTSDYTTSDVSSNSVIVSCNDKSKVVDYNNIYVTSYDSSTYSQTSEFDGEGQITSAIDYVTSENVPVIYTLSGHNETELSSDFINDIEKQNLSVESLDLLNKGQVPDDCACLIILGPQKDLSLDEASAVKEYLKSGGKAFISTAYTGEDTEFTNFYSVLEEYNTKVDEGIVIEADSSSYANPYPSYILPTLSSESTITSTISAENMRILLPVAQAFETIDENNTDITITPLLTSSSSSYLKVITNETQSYDKDEGAKEGSFNLSTLITKSIKQKDVSADESENDSLDNKTALILVSTPHVANDQINQTVAGANEDFVINSLSYLCQHKSSISIHSKSLSVDYLTLSAGQKNLWSILLVIVLPIVIIGTGLFVWLRRRHK